MSGHSKWHNIQHKKGAADAARSGLFTKLAREITMAAKLGDKNPDNNPRLRLAILTARKNSMPNDNPRRTVPEIRNIFGKNGGNMGEEGSVVFMFTRAGQIMYPASIGKTEDEMMEIIMDANADNLETSEEGFIITTKPEDFVNAQKYLADILGEPEQAELTWLPNMPMDLDDEAYAKLEKLVDALDANDDVQKVFTAAA